MKVRKGSIVFLLVVSILVCLLSFPVSAASTDRALLIQSDLPWYSNANTNILNQLVTEGHFASYDVHTFSEVGNAAFDLAVYKVVIIANDQSQSSYDQYNADIKSKLETYASSGGVVVFGACHVGWNAGNITTALPGGTTITFDSDDYNIIVDTTNSIVTAALSDNIALTDLDLVGSSCNHISFIENSLPAGANVIFRTKSTNTPTLVEYPLGNGHVIASGLTWEYYYENGGNFAEKAFDDLFLYALLLANASQDAPTGLAGAATVTVGGSDGRITGTTTAMEYKLSTDSVYTPVAGTEITGLPAGTYHVRFAEKEGFDAGADATVTVNDSQAAPTGLAGVAPLAYGGSDGKITGTTTAMEYKLSTDSVYIPAAGTEIADLAAGTYHVRYAAKTGFDPSADTAVTVPVGPNASQSAPAGLAGITPLVYGGSDGKITGTTTAMEYKLSTASSYTPAAGTEITGLAAGTYQVRYAAKTGFDPSADTAVTVPVGPNASQTAPAGLAGIAPLTYGGSDGRITGITAAMEYKLSAASSYTPAAGTEITGLAAGTYQVRYAAKTGFDASADTAVTVPVGPNASQSAPAGLGVTASTSGGSTGMITGTTTAMEYRLSTASSYTPVTGTEIKSLVAGAYYVRYAARAGYDASAETSVIITDVQGASIVAPAVITPAAAPAAVTPVAAPAATLAAAPALLPATGENDNNLLLGLLMLLAAVPSIGVIILRAGKKTVVRK